MSRIKLGGVELRDAEYSKLIWYMVMREQTPDRQLRRGGIWSRKVQDRDVQISDSERHADIKNTTDGTTTCKTAVPRFRQEFPKQCTYSPIPNPPCLSLVPVRLRYPHLSRLQDNALDPVHHQMDSQARQVQATTILVHVACPVRLHPA